MRKTPLRRVSKKRQAQLKEYGKLRKEYLEEHSKCEVCQSRNATEIHHKMGRGKHTNDVEYFVAICRTCHNNVHFGTNQGYGPSWARENGWLI